MTKSRISRRAPGSFLKKNHDVLAAAKTPCSKKTTGRPAWNSRRSCGPRQDLHLQPVADLEKPQRLDAHGGTQPVLPEQRRIGWVCLQSAKFGGERCERRSVGERPFPDQD